MKRYYIYGIGKSRGKKTMGVAKVYCKDEKQKS